MSDAFTVDAGALYAFAPLPDPIEGTLHRIYIICQGSDGRHWSDGTDLMAATRESAADFCNGLNLLRGFDRDGWAVFAELPAKIQLPLTCAIIQLERRADSRPQGNPSDSRGWRSPNGVMRCHGCAHS